MTTHSLRNRLASLTFLALAGACGFADSDAQAQIFGRRAQGGAYRYKVKERGYAVAPAYAAPYQTRTFVAPAVPAYLGQTTVTETEFYRPAPVVQQHIYQPPAYVESRVVQPPPVVENRFYQPAPVIQQRSYSSSYPY